MNGEEAQAARPGAIARNLVTHHQCMAVIPVFEEGASGGVVVASEFTVDIEAPAANRVKAEHHMLQWSLGALVIVIGSEYRFAIGIAFAGAIHADVVVIVLSEGEVALGSAAGVADDARRIVVIGALVKAVGNNPGLNGVFAGAE